MLVKQGNPRALVAGGEWHDHVGSSENGVDNGVRFTSQKWRGPKSG